MNVQHESSFAVLQLIFLVNEVSDRLLYTHRRSIMAERGGCHQQRLFVCQCVCVCQYVCTHDNSRTTRRRTIKLGG